MSFEFAVVPITLETGTPYTHLNANTHTTKQHKRQFHAKYIIPNNKAKIIYKTLFLLNNLRIEICVNKKCIKLGTR